MRSPIAFSSPVDFADLGLKVSERVLQARALHFYRLAASQDSSSANLRLGDYYYYGWGTEQDLSKSAAFYQASCNLRSAQVCSFTSMLTPFIQNTCRSYSISRFVSN